MKELKKHESQFVESVRIYLKKVWSLSALLQACAQGQTEPISDSGVYLNNTLTKNDTRAVNMLHVLVSLQEVNQVSLTKASCESTFRNSENKDKFV